MEFVQHRCRKEEGSTLILAMSTIAVLSVVGASVLLNSATRYNTTSTQVKGWKEALTAAEAGGDIAFNVIRKDVTNPSNALNAASGWSSPAPAPLPGTDSWSFGFDPGSPFVFGTDNRFSTKITVDKFAIMPGSSTGIGYYRIRSIGTAQLTGLKRVGMDNRMTSATTGDNLLRKIDFNFDHFLATYGYGDALPSAAATTANGKATGVAVKDAGKPQVTRRIELVAVPVMPIEGAVKTAGSFRGTTVDSYDSKNGSYKGSNPASPYDVDAHDGDVVVGNSTFSAGYVYGNVTTNGGAATTSKASGVVDNNVPIAVPTATPGVSPIPALPDGSAVAGPSSSLTPPTTKLANGTLKTTFWYNYTNVSDLTIHSLKTANGTPIDTTVNLYVTNDVNGLNIDEGVSVNVYFRGDMGSKARDYDNLNSDGPIRAWDFFYATAAERTGATGFTAADVGKIAYQDGNPGTYWKLTAVTPTWASYTPSSPNVPAENVVCTQVAPKWTFATAATRGAATGLTSADVGKYAYQTDTQTFYKLTSASPAAWASVSQPYQASSLVSRAGHMWYWGISPADGSARSIAIGPPGTMYAAFYAPSHDFSVNGNPDIYGVVVSKSFYQNGSTAFHFDKQLATSATPLDYRVASYIEDVR